MIIALIVLALIFAHITYRDVKSRLVYRRDLFALIIVRAVLFVVVLVGEEVFGLSSVLGLSNEQWGLAPLIVSVALAVITCVIVQSVAFITNRLTNKYGEKEESLGLGDVWLYAVCCLFLTVETWFVFVFLSALIGVVMALYCKVIKKQCTFPFAPAIVWSCFVMVCARAAGLI